MYVSVAQQQLSTIFVESHKKSHQLRDVLNKTLLHTNDDVLEIDKSLICLEQPPNKEKNGVKKEDWKRAFRILLKCFGTSTTKDAWKHF